MFHRGESNHGSSGSLQFIRNPVVGNIVQPNEGSQSEIQASTRQEHSH